MAYKVFTNGSVLNASEINENLMRQSVMVFSNAAARTAAITAPVEGMISWLEDVNQFQNYDGTNWVSAAVGMGSGLVHLRTTNFTGVSSVSVGSNAEPVFSSLYDNYRIIFSSLNSTNTDRNYSFRLRANTTDESRSIYSVMNDGINRAGGSTPTTGVNVSSANIMPNAFYTSDRCTTSFDLMFPFIANINTTGMGNLIGIDSTHFFHQSFSWNCASTLSYNGFTVINTSGNFVDGSVSIYGYRKN